MSTRSSEWGPILVGTDGSEGAARAIDAAGGLAVALNTDLWIANVIDDASETDVARFSRMDQASIGDVTEAKAHLILDEAVHRARAGGARKVRTVLRSGACADEIIAAARDMGAKAVFVGRRGAGGRLAQAFIGSVSQKLAGMSPTMLVIVP